MKRRNFVRLSGIGAGALMAGLYGCEKIVPSPEDPEIIPGELIYGNFKNKILSYGLENPSGISLYESGKKSMLKSETKASSLEELVFCSSPIFNGTQTEFLINPKIFNYEGDLMTTNLLYEFQNEDIDYFKTDNLELIRNEEGNTHFINGVAAYRSIGSNLDTAILPGGNILFSSIVSNKILSLNGGEKNIYLEDDDLIGINNMIYGSDDKVYLTQVAIRNSNGQIIRPKRVLSLDNSNNLNLEIELPEGTHTNSNLKIRSDHSLYGGDFLEIGSQVRMVENLDQKLDPSKFYVLDQFSKAIYKISEGGLINLLENTSPEIYPSGIAAEIKGKIYYITSPLFSLETSGISHFPELRVLDPKKIEQNTLYSLILVLTFLILGLIHMK